MSDESAPTPPPIDDPSASSQTPPPVNPGGFTGLPVPGQGKLSEKDDKTFGLLAHLLGVFTSAVGPLVIWLVKREESPFVDDQGKEALNFQITVAMGYAAAVIANFLPVVGCLAALLFPVIWVAGLIFAILGTVEANKGNAYRYPFAARFIN